jgi:molybdate transport system substrate-binding protein
MADIAHERRTSCNSGERERIVAMKILCTNGLKTVMLDLMPAFERASGTKVVTVWGSANGLLKELESGASGDVVILTAEAIDDLIARGKVIAAGRVDLARSGIGVAVRKGANRPDIASPEALKRALLAARSVAHSKTGMSGIYFPTVLARLGIVEEMKSKIVMPDPGTPVGEVIAKGDAEIGVQQISELLPVSGIEIVGPLPDALQKITTFTAGVLAATKEPEAARALLEFVASRSPPLLKQRGLEPA